MKEVKRIVKVNGRWLVENVSFKSIEAEWVFYREAIIVKPLFGVQWFQWVFGSCFHDVGIIQIFMDNILKSYELFGNCSIEDYLTRHFCKHQAHELIHALAPQWNESEVEKASDLLFEVRK